MWKVLEDVTLVLFSATRTASLSDRTEKGRGGEGEDRRRGKEVKEQRQVKSSLFLV